MGLDMSATPLVRSDRNGTCGMSGRFVGLAALFRVRVARGMSAGQIWLKSVLAWWRVRFDTWALLYFGVSRAVL